MGLVVAPLDRGVVEGVALAVALPDREVAVVAVLAVAPLDRGAVAAAEASIRDGPFPLGSQTQ